MGQQAATLPSVKTTLKRWLQDRAEEAGISYDELAEKAGMSPNKLTICEKHPEKAHTEEVVGLANALGLHWYNDLVMKWGFGKIRIDLDTASKLASEEGMVFGLVVNTAA